MDKVADEADGFEQVLAQLDRYFKYNDRVEMPRALEKFYGSARRGDQSLLQYCADHREACRELEKHKIAIPDSISGWFLLRRSSLTYEQRQMVQTHCTSLEKNKVEESLYYFFSQDYKGRSDVRWEQMPLQRNFINVGLADIKPTALRGPMSLMTWMPLRRTMPMSMGWTAAEETEDGYYHNDENSGDFDGALEEAYAAYLDARRQFANLRAARGYYPVLLWRRMHHPAVLDNNIQFLLVMAKAR